MNEETQLRKIVSKIVRLPALPDNVLALQRLIRSPETTAETVGRAIARDQALSAQVLKLVNSGFYGFSTPVASISHAVVLLGFGALQTLLVSTAAVQLIGAAFPGLYPHSLACARIAYVLARRLGLDEPDELSTAGLLHDIGKMVLASHVPEEYEAVKRAVREKNMLFLEAETETMGVTHADIGAWLLAQWRLPAQTVEPIRHHHAFEPDMPFAERAATLHLADILARAEGVGDPGDSRMPRLDVRALATLGIGLPDIRPLMDEAFDQLTDLFSGEDAA